MSEHEAIDFIEMASVYGPKLVKAMWTTVVAVVTTTAFVVTSWWDIRTRLDSLDRYGSEYARSHYEKLDSRVNTLDNRVTVMEAR